MIGPVLAVHFETGFLANLSRVPLQPVNHLNLFNDDINQVCGHWSEENFGAISAPL